LTDREIVTIARIMQNTQTRCVLTRQSSLY